MLNSSKNIDRKKKKEKNRRKKFTLKFAKVWWRCWRYKYIRIHDFKGFINRCIVMLECLAHCAYVIYLATELKPFPREVCQKCFIYSLHFTKNFTNTHQECELLYYRWTGEHNLNKTASGQKIKINLKYNLNSRYTILPCEMNKNAHRVRVCIVRFCDKL